VKRTLAPKDSGVIKPVKTLKLTERFAAFTHLEKKGKRVEEEKKGKHYP